MADRRVLNGNVFPRHPLIAVVLCLKPYSAPSESPTAMPLDPTDYRTWTTFKDHPIFSADKSQIEAWSHDSSQYCGLDAYGRFWPDHYVHIDPAPAVEYQEQVAERDIKNLGLACCQIEKNFGSISYELVILDDFTAFVWIRHQQLMIEIYPCFPDEDAILKMLVDLPNGEECEFDCPSVPNLVEALSQLLGTEQTDEREPE